jgi:hypothetical protein
MIMAEYWFRPKRYGYGATPTTWQGWALTIAIVLAMVAVSLYLRLTARGYWALAVLVAFDVIALGALATISYWKTDGAWRWRWGED